METEYHEAGHTVADVFQGLKFRYVTVRPRTRNTAAHVVYAPGGRDLLRSGAWEREAISDAAGIIAEDLEFGGGISDRSRRVWLRKKLVREVGRTDMKSLRLVTRFAYCMEQVKPGWSSTAMYDDDTPVDLAKRAWRKAVHLVTTHWEAVEAVAEALSETKTLLYDEVLAVIEESDFALLPEEEILECLEASDWDPWFLRYSRLRWDPSEQWYAQVREDVARHREEVARHAARSKKSGRTG